jgi:hypothetical protein
MPLRVLLLSNSHMKTNKKNISWLLAIALLWAINFGLSKDIADKSAAQANNSEWNNTKALASIDCSEIKQWNVSEISSTEKNDYLFIGCNWFY